MHRYDSYEEEELDALYEYVSMDLWRDKEITLLLIDFYGDELPLVFIFSNLIV